MALIESTRRALDLIREVGEYQVRHRAVTTEELRGVFMVSERTLRRDIEEARRLGAELVSVKEGNRYIWCCLNYGEISEELHALRRFDRHGFQGEQEQLR